MNKNMKVALWTQEKILCEYVAFRISDMRIWNILQTIHFYLFVCQTVGHVCEELFLTWSHHLDCCWWRLCPQHYYGDMILKIKLNDTTKRQGDFRLLGKRWRTSLFMTSFGLSETGRGAQARVIYLLVFLMFDQNLSTARDWWSVPAASSSWDACGRSSKGRSASGWKSNCVLLLYISDTNRFMTNPMTLHVWGWVVRNKCSCISLNIHHIETFLKLNMWIVMGSVLSAAFFLYNVLFLITVLVSVQIICNIQ